MRNQTAWILRKQMLEDRIKNITSLLNVSEDEAFMRLAYALLFNTSYDDPSYDTDVVDGGGDKQIDIIRIDELADQAVIHFAQVKNSDKYKGTTVVQIRDGLEWSFKLPEEKYKKLVNSDLVMKISAIRELSGRLGLRKLDVIVHYITKGDRAKLSPDFQQEVQHTVDLYIGSNEFRSFYFKVWGFNELVDRSYEIEQESRQINVDIPIYLTHYAPSYCQYRSSSIKAAICTIDGTELARLVNQHQSQIFEENVRTYLGTKKRVNAAILQTCSDDALSEHFWFFNNGITVTCDDFDVSYNAHPPCIKISNMQIVNGCQTSMTLADAQKDGKLSNKTKVLLKVYATKDAKFVDEITYTTNSQNAVSSRDLRSNDLIQRDLEKLFKARGYYYERKPRMFINISKQEKNKIISNEKLGQAHLAIVQHLPAISMAQPARIWADYYDDIYSSRVNELLASYLLYSYCLQVQNARKSLSGLSTLERSILKYGTFHMSRVLGSYQLGEYWKKEKEETLSELIQKIEGSSEDLEEDYKRAKELLKQIVEKLAGGDFSRLMNIFKSGEIQKELDVALSKV